VYRNPASLFCYYVFWNCAHLSPLSPSPSSFSGSGMQSLRPSHEPLSNTNTSKERKKKSEADRKHFCSYAEVIDSKQSVAAQPNESEYTVYYMYREEQLFALTCNRQLCTQSKYPPVVLSPTSSIVNSCHIVYFAPCTSSIIPQLDCH
jgi:hypothetical protein